MRTSKKKEERGILIIHLNKEGEKMTEKFGKIDKKKILQKTQSVTISKSGWDWPIKVLVLL